MLAQNWLQVAQLMVKTNESSSSENILAEEISIETVQSRALQNGVISLNILK